MNAYNFFKFLKDKRGKKFPFLYKFRTAPETLTAEDLHIKGSLVFGEGDDGALPDNLTIEGDLILTDTHTKYLPKNLTVGASLDVRDSPDLEYLPDNLTVGGDLSIEGSRVSEIPYNLNVGGFYAGYTPLASKYSEQQIKKMIVDRKGSVKRLEIENPEDYTPFPY